MWVRERITKAFFLRRYSNSSFVVVVVVCWICLYDVLRAKVVSWGFLSFNVTSS